MPLPVYDQNGCMKNLACWEDDQEQHGTAPPHLCTRSVEHCSAKMILMQMETVFNPKVGLSWQNEWLTKNFCIFRILEISVLRSVSLMCFSMKFSQVLFVASDKISERSAQSLIFTDFRAWCLKDLRSWVFFSIALGLFLFLFLVGFFFLIKKKNVCYFRKKFSLTQKLAKKNYRRSTSL